MNSVIALVDCNNFFVSCEKVFNPKLKGKPVVVLSNNDGCVVSRSDEAKAMGVELGIPAFKIDQLFRSKKLIAYSSNYQLYGDMSQRVMETLSYFAPAMDVYSIDEAFLDLSGIECDKLTDYGHMIRRTVKKWTGIPVTIGIAETKVLAKIANWIAKKSQKADGVLNLTDSTYQEKALSMVPVEKVWGIGRQYAKFLKLYGIETAFDLRNTEDSWVRKYLSIVGLRIVKELRGIPSISMEESPSAKKQICVSRSLGKLVTSLDDIREAIATFASRAGERLREERLAAGVIMVFIQTNRFKNEPQYFNATALEFPVPTDCTQELIQFALKCVEKIFRKGFRFYRVGVALADLVPANQIQTDLFDTKDYEVSKRLTQTIDAINTYMGSDTLKYAAVGMTQGWKTRFSKLSPRYTTRWSDLMKVSV